MKKTTVYFLSLICLTLIIGASIFLISHLSKNDNAWSSNWSRTITVKDGVADPGKTVADFTISKEDDYRLSFSWIPAGHSKNDVAKISPANFGFLTALLLYAPSGDLIYGTSATAMTADPVVDLAPGTYHAEFHYLTSASDYEAFAAQYLCGTYSAPYWASQNADIFSSLQKNGTWEVDYSLSVSTDGSLTTASMMAVVCGLLIGVVLLFLFLAMITKGNRISSPKYDERQELERGRGFRYAFFSMLLFLLLLFILDSALQLEGTVFRTLTILTTFVGLNVYVIYCLWHEAYFALNQKTTSVMILFCFIGISNLAIAIINYLDGSMIKDGQFGPSILNLFCAFTFLNVFAVMFIKRCVNAKLEKTVGAEDDEDE